MLEKMIRLTECRFRQPRLTSFRVFVIYCRLLFLLFVTVMITHALTNFFESIQKQCRRCSFFSTRNLLEDESSQSLPSFIKKR